MRHYKNIIAVVAIALLSGCTSINFDRGDVSLTDAELRAIEVAETMPTEMWEGETVTESVAAVEVTDFPIPRPRPVINEAPAVDAFTMVEMPKAVPVAPNGETAPAIVEVEVEDISLPVVVAVAVEELPTPVLMKEINYTDNQLNCLAQNIYFEARGESVEGMTAVALVTVNRVLSKRYPSTICNVVWQRKQFSWTHDGMSDTPKNRRAWALANTVAELVLNEYDRKEYDFTHGALWYHADYVRPKWSARAAPTTKIGAHLFYASL